MLPFLAFVRSALPRWLLACLIAIAGGALAYAEPDDFADLPVPPRLSATYGSVSFWRPGSDDWSPAQLNTPLAPGDALHTSDASSLELQIGPQAYLYAAQNSLLVLTDNRQGTEQFRLDQGVAALDVRRLAPDQRISLQTPGGSFDIAGPGYYRTDVTGQRMRLIVRRDGRAMLHLANGQTHVVNAGEAAEFIGDGGVIIRGAGASDAWDNWNFSRSDANVAAESQRYVPNDMYGASDLDRYGSWRVEPEYGPVWTPFGLAADWAPYSTGSWVWDPLYGWTWVDVAPWGWAPFHYGRWVQVRGIWAWAPGPRPVRPVYAPALVAFFRCGPGTAVQASLGGSGVGWVALSWGEPVYPWWGRVHDRPWWGGWNGPRIAEQRLTERPGPDALRYRNVRLPGAVIAVRDPDFGRGRVGHAVRLAPEQAARLDPLRDVPLRRERESALGNASLSPAPAVPALRSLPSPAPHAFPRTPTDAPVLAPRLPEPARAAPGIPQVPGSIALPPQTQPQRPARELRWQERAGRAAEEAPPPAPPRNEHWHRFEAPTGQDARPAPRIESGPALAPGMRAVPVPQTPATPAILPQQPPAAAEAQQRAEHFRRFEHRAPADVAPADASAPASGPAQGAEPSPREGRRPHMLGR